MSEQMKYLTPKKSVSAIARDRAEQAAMQNIDIYEAIAGLFEELAGLAEENAALEERVAQLENGGK